MIHLAPVDRSQVYRAFMEAFTDYAMDASGTQESSLFLRMDKNAVDYTVSPGAYDGSRLVGFTLIGIDALGEVRSAYDAGTGIVPEFRGQGLAMRMFDHALPALRARRIARFHLEVLQSNERAIKAYERAGFAVHRELRCYVAEKRHLLALTDCDSVEVRPSNAQTFESLVAEADWTPSFENRFTAHRSLPGHVTFLGAYDGDECIGIIAYCPALHWLLTLLVRRGHRGKGVGRALLHHLATTLPENVSRLAALNVDGGDQGMQAFFAALGFEHLVDQFEMTLDVS
jgi:ribosomal protein S18 acetylase RimI-like enzyme